MKQRRFDTKALMKMFLEGDQQAFNHIYERYSGRIYRFIVRQCGTAPIARSLYLTVWAEFVDARRQYNSPNKLKMALYRILHENLRAACQESEELHQQNRIITKSDGVQWRITLLDHLRRLPVHLREVFLYRHEMGLNSAMICRVMGESKPSVERQLTQAVQLLEQELDNDGCPAELSPIKLYQESRVLKSPSFWDNEVLTTLPTWLEGDLKNTHLKQHIDKKQLVITEISTTFDGLRKSVQSIATSTKQELFKAISTKDQALES